MIELILGSIVFGLIGVIVYERGEHRKTQSKLLNAIMSKSPEQFRDLELADKVKPIESPKRVEPDLIAEHDLDDKQFQEMISKGLKN